MKKVTDEKTASCGRDARTTVAAARVISVVTFPSINLRMTTLIARRWDAKGGPECWS